MLRKFNKFQLINEYYFFRIIYTISGYFIFAFYLILLYKSTNSFAALVIDSLFFYTFIWVGVIIAGFLMERIGYINTYRFSNIMQGIVAILVALNLNNLGSLFIIFAILRSIPRGIYWQVDHMYQLGEFSVGERTMTINILTSLGDIFNIIFPFLVGSVITLSGDYFLVMLAGGIMLILGAFVPWSYNKKPKTDITSKEIIRIIKHPKFKSFAWLNIIQAGMDLNIGMIFIILPFLFLKTEFGIGILASIMNLFAAIIVFLHRKSKMGEEIKLGTIGTVLYSLSNFIFTIIFSFPMLVIRSLVTILTSSATDPVTAQMDLKIKDHLLGTHKKESTTEMNLITETLYFIGRISFSCILLFLITLNTGDQLFAFKVLVFLQTFWNIIYFVWIVRMQKNDNKTDHPETLRQPNSHLFSWMKH